MEFKVSENTNDNDIEDIHKSILTSIANSMRLPIKESTYGAVNANHQRTDGFYIVNFLSTIYMLQHDELVDNELLKAGSLVTDSDYMSPAMKESVG
eukprot:6456689-Ditylum_brightwellii.AAC.1